MQANTEGVILEQNSNSWWEKDKYGERQLSSDKPHKRHA